LDFACYDKEYGMLAFGMLFEYWSHNAGPRKGHCSRNEAPVNRINDHLEAKNREILHTYSLLLSSETRDEQCMPIPKLEGSNYDFETSDISKHPT